MKTLIIAGMVALIALLVVTEEVDSAVVLACATFLYALVINPFNS